MYAKIIRYIFKNQENTHGPPGFSEFLIDISRNEHFEKDLSKLRLYV